MPDLTQLHFVLCPFPCGSSTTLSQTPGSRLAAKPNKALWNLGLPLSLTFPLLPKCATVLLAQLLDSMCDAHACSSFRLLACVPVNKYSLCLWSWHSAGDAVSRQCCDTRMAISNPWGWSMCVCGRWCGLLLNHPPIFPCWLLSPGAAEDDPDLRLCGLSFQSAGITGVLRNAWFVPERQACGCEAGTLPAEPHSQPPPSL